MLFGLFPSFFELLLIGFIIYSAVSISKLKKRVQQLDSKLHRYIPEEQPLPSSDTKAVVMPPIKPSQTLTAPTQAPAAPPRPMGAPPMPTGAAAYTSSQDSALPTTPAAPARPTAQMPVPVPTSVSASASEVPSGFEPSLNTDSSSLEKLVGQNIFGFVAAGLVFIGLILLGILVAPYLGDIIRCALMYLLSTAFLTVGFIVAKRQPSANTIPFATEWITPPTVRPMLSSILLGTGAGGFFISLLITRLYFGYLDDLGVLALLLLWAASCMYLVKRFDSIVLAVVAHVGMVISVCFAYTFGFNDTSIFIVMVYQLLACLIVVGGSLMSMRKAYSAGLLVSLFLTLVASHYLWQHFTADNLYSSSLLWLVIPDYATGFYSKLSNMYITLIFFIQFATASFILFLLRKALMQNQRSSQHTMSMAAHVVGEFLWLYALFINVYKVLPNLFLYLTHPNFRTSDNSLFNHVIRETLHWGADATIGVCILILILHAGIIVYSVRKQRFDAALGKISVIAASYVAAIFLLINAPHFIWVPYVPQISGLLFVTLALYALSHVQHDKAYAVAGHIILGIEALYLLCWGYLQPISSYGVAGALALLATTSAPLIWWSRYGYGVNAEAQRVPVLLSILVFFELSMAVIPFAADLPAEHVALFRLAQLMGLFVFFPGLPRTAYTGMSFLQAQEKSVCSRGWIVAAQVNEVVLLLNFINHISGTTDVPIPARNVFVTALCLVYAALILALIVARVWEYAQHPTYASAPVQVVWAILFTLLCPAILNRLGILGELGYAASLVYMTCAFICIVIGFKLNFRPMRLYGLIVMMLCVLKMVLFDFGDGSTISRVVAFIIGGILCFAISFLYNYAAKKLASTPQIENAPTAENTDADKNVNVES